jgi:thioesterase domain-containing protein/acyl carrier protein
VVLGSYPGRLRVIVSSGEQLRVNDDIRVFCAELDDPILENQYGPTETHVVTSYTMRGNPAGYPDLPPIGRAIDGTRVLLLDSQSRPVPAGVQGEIHLGGRCLMRGYLGAPELTAERLIPDPERPGEMLYRTGDLGYQLADGPVVCLGRADNQVKVRGFRVEPAEVELAIAGIVVDGIREVAVVARNRDGVDGYLAAFLVGQPSAVDLSKVRSALRARLPEHLVPSYIGWLPELPKTPSGKRDDAALRAVPLTEPPPSAARAPRDGYEASMVEMLSSLLSREHVGVDDNFFDLGGTSLTAMRLVMMVEKRYRMDIPLSTFISAPTVAGLARRLRDERATATFDPLVRIRAAGHRPPLFLVHPIGGNVLCYVPLSRHLAAGQPVYALQAAGADAGTAPASSIPEIAAGYLRAIRRIQPRGPYTVGGWSFGGFVALEMARQLQQQGERVDRLIVLDSIALEPGRARADEKTLLEWFFWELLHTDPGGDRPPIVIPASLTTDAARFDFILENAVAAGALPPDSATGGVHRLFAIFRANWHAMIDYRPDRTDLDITLIRASDPLPTVLEPAHRAAGSMHGHPTNGWSTVTTGAVRVHDVPGDHLQILQEPYVKAVAAAITTVTEGHPAPDACNGTGTWTAESERQPSSSERESAA